MGHVADHWNDILHNDGANFHKKMEGAEADVMIQAEFNTGKIVLLRADKFLLRSFCTTMKLELQEKKKWLHDVCRSQSSIGGQTESTPLLRCGMPVQMHVWLMGTHSDSHHNTDSRALSRRRSLAKSDSKQGQQWHCFASKHSPQGPKQNNTTG